MIRQALLSVFVLACFWQAASGQEPAAAADETLTVPPAVSKLDGLLTRMSAFLKATPGFKVEAKSKWQLDGVETPGTGSVYQLQVQNPGIGRLDIGGTEESSGKLTCVSDGETITRLFSDGRMHAHSTAPGDVHDFAKDAFTDSSLRGSGIDLILEPDREHIVMTSVSDVQSLGTEEVAGQQAEHFRCTWDRSADIEFWIATGERPVLLRLIRKQEVAVEANQPRQLTISTEFTWSHNLTLAPEQLELKLPEGAFAVKDLQTFLLQGATHTLLGKPAPQVEFRSLDAKPWDIAQYRGKSVVVLFFWSSWAAPSVEEKVSLAAFLEKYKERAKFYAVNVGESADAVRGFISKANYPWPVLLDPDQQGSAAYRITSVPVAVIVGLDGTIQAVHVGNSPEQRTLFERDLEQVLAGKPLVVGEP